MQKVVVEVPPAASLLRRIHRPVLYAVAAMDVDLISGRTALGALAFLLLRGDQRLTIAEPDSQEDRDGARTVRLPA